MPTFATPEPITVSIELVLGGARVTASDRSDTVVAVRPSTVGKAVDVEAAEQTTVELVDGRLVVAAPKNWRRYTPFGKDGSVDIVVEVPTGSSLEGDSALGDFHAEGELGRCRLRTAMGNIWLDHVDGLQLKTSYGNITVDHADGDVDVTTGSGQIRLGEVRGTAVIKNSNGTTSVEDVQGDLRVRSSNGTIAIGRAGASVHAKTASGDIRLGEVRRGIVDLQTAAGELDLGIRQGTAAWLDVSSQLGRVRNDLDTTDEPTATDETVEVRARTSVGDIVIRRSPEVPATSTT